MPLQLSTAVRNARLDAIESTIGTAPTLEIRTGSQPANCAASSTGTLLASMTLPSDWAAAASSGTKGLSGTWQDASANATGTAGYFRIIQSGTCHVQGSVTAEGGGGDLQLDNVSIAANQVVTIVSMTLTEGNA